MPAVSHAPPNSPRLTWIDISKAISILWIVFFHFFSTYDTSNNPLPIHSGFLSSLFAGFISSCTVSAIKTFTVRLFTGVVYLAPNAVGVFLIISGFGLTYSLTKAGGPREGWGRWYRKRLLRLFPMYWVAHLVYLVSPFVARPEPIDYRFILSFLGDRIYPLDMIFYYANPAWWFFGLLVELYVVFPALFWLLQRVGPGRFLLICALLTFFSRYLILFVFKLDIKFIQGALFLARLWEFAAGICLAYIYRQSPGTVHERLFSKRALIAGCIAYACGIAAYRSYAFYTVTDMLTGTGLFIVLAHVAHWYGSIPFFGPLMTYIGIYSYSLYLLHQPYVIYFGEHMRGFSLPIFIVSALGIIAIITFIATFLEQRVNRISSRVLEASRSSSPSPASTT